MEDLSNQINEEGQKYISTAIEEEEPDISDLQYTDGKERDNVDAIEEKEKMLGINKISPFGAGNILVFKKKLARMKMPQKVSLAEKTSTRVFKDESLQDNALIRAFHEWKMTNWDSGRTMIQAQVEELSSDSVEDFESKLRKKTLSELQETAMKLGLTPSFDRVRIIAALKQQFLDQI